MFVFHLAGYYMARLGLWLLILCAFEANAAAKAKVSAELGLNGAWMYFAEFNAQNDRLLTESGWIPGLQGAINWSYLGLELTGSVQMYQGKVKYDGQAKSIFGVAKPYQSTTDTLLVNTGLQLLLSMDIERRWWLETSISRNSWNRKILGGEGVGRLAEHHRWWKLSAGAQYRMFPKAYLQGSLSWMPGAYLDVSTAIASGRVEQPDGSGVNLKISYPFGHGGLWRFHGGYSYEYFPRSQIVTDGSTLMNQPQNERHLFNLGFAKQF